MTTVPTKTIYRDRTTGEYIRLDGEYPDYMCMPLMLASVNLMQGRTVVIAASDELALAEELLLRGAITLWVQEVQP